MSFRVRYTRGARDDLRRLHSFLLKKDIQAARRARDAIAKGISFLAESPFSCRKAAPDTPLLRELVIPFGSAGYVGCSRSRTAKPLPSSQSAIRGKTTTSDRRLIYGTRICTRDRGWRRRRKLSNQGVPGAGDAAVYYAAEASLAIAQAFLAEYERVRDLIIENQRLGPHADGDLRGFHFDRFPYTRPGFGCI